METVCLFGSYTYEDYKSKNSIYVDNDIFENEASLKVINLVRNIHKLGYDPKVESIEKKKMFVVENIDDGYDENNTDSSDSECFLYSCQIIKGLNWQLILIKDAGIIFDINGVRQFTVYSIHGHPCIICSEFIFKNSDGSTDWKNIDKIIGLENVNEITIHNVWNIIREAQNRILEYAFNPIH